jgi:hypothetical protein
LGLCRTLGAALATARSSAWFHHSPLPALPASVAASVVTPARRATVVEGAGAACGKQGKGLRRASVGVVVKYTACSKASRAHAAGCGTPSKLSIFPNLRPGGNECRWARFLGNVLVQTIAQKTIWARNSSKMSRFGQDFDPCPNFGLGERPGGERFVVSKPKF